MHQGSSSSSRALAFAPPTSPTTTLGHRFPHPPGRCWTRFFRRRRKVEGGWMMIDGRTIEYCMIKVRRYEARRRRRAACYAAHCEGSTALALQVHQFLQIRSCACYSTLLRVSVLPPDSEALRLSDQRVEASRRGAICFSFTGFHPSGGHRRHPTRKSAKMLLESMVST